MQSQRISFKRRDQYISNLITASFKHTATLGRSTPAKHDTSAVDQTCTPNQQGLFRNRRPQPSEVPSCGFSKTANGPCLYDLHKLNLRTWEGAFRGTR